MQLSLTHRPTSYNKLELMFMLYLFVVGVNIMQALGRKGKKLKIIIQKTSEGRFILSSLSPSGICLP